MATPWPPSSPRTRQISPPGSRSWPQWDPAPQRSSITCLSSKSGDILASDLSILLILASDWSNQVRGWTLLKVNTVTATSFSSESKFAKVFGKCAKLWPSLFNFEALKSSNKHTWVLISWNLQSKLCCPWNTIRKWNSSIFVNYFVTRSFCLSFCYCSK